MLDGRGGVQENVVIVVAGSRITGVSRSAEPATYDLTGFTVLPGGIDTHNHIAWHFDPDGKIHHLSAEEETPAQAALDLRDWIARGTIPGPRIITSLAAITQNTGTPEQIRETVRQRAAQGADVIKIFGSASIRDGGPPTRERATFHPSRLHRDRARCPARRRHP